MGIMSPQPPQPPPGQGAPQPGGRPSPQMILQALQVLQAAGVPMQLLQAVVQALQGGAGQQQGAPQQQGNPQPMQGQ